MNQNIDIAIQVMEDVVRRELPFNMLCYAPWEEYHLLNLGDTLIPSCYTAGCVIGHICADERGQATGLKLVLTKYLERLLPVFGDDEGVAAIAKWADISELEAHVLFGPYERTALEELNILRLFVGQGYKAAWDYATFLEEKR